MSHVAVIVIDSAGMRSGISTDQFLNVYPTRVGLLGDVTAKS